MVDKLVIFSLSGLGAHHLANIIATCGKYDYTVDYSKYFEPGLANAHHDHDTLDAPSRGILIYHFGTADKEKISEIRKNCKTRFIVIHMPRTNQLAWSRIQHANRIDIVDNPLMYDLEIIYKQQFLSRLYPGQWDTVMSDDLFSDNPDKIIQSVERILGCELQQRRLISDIHQAWISKVKKNPNPYSGIVY